MFEHYVKTRAEEERKEKRAAQKAAIEGFKQLLDSASEVISFHIDYPVLYCYICSWIFWINVELRWLSSKPLEQAMIIIIIFRKHKFSLFLLSEIKIPLTKVVYVLKF